MSKRSSLMISIPEPCHESWENMTAVEKGKFCLSCQQTVKDFSNMTDREVIAYVNAHQKGHHCGQFMASQLNKMLSADTPSLKFFPAAFLASAFIAFTPQRSNAQQPLQTTQQVAQKILLADTMIVIKGRVIEKGNHQPVIVAPIY